MIKNYYIVTIFENTSDVYNGLEEMIRERIYHYKRSQTPIDFWILKNVKYNEIFNNFEEITTTKTNLLEKINNLPKGFTLITTSKIFFEWMKLRYGYFENIINSNDLDKFRNSIYTIDGYSVNVEKIDFINSKLKFLKK